MTNAEKDELAWVSTRHLDGDAYCQGRADMRREIAERIRFMLANGNSDTFIRHEILMWVEAS